MGLLCVLGYKGLVMLFVRKGGTMIEKGQRVVELSREGVVRIMPRELDMEKVLKGIKWGVTGVVSWVMVKIIKKI